MRGVDEPRQAVGPAVGRTARRVDVDAVVAPAARARELGDRHELDRGDAELGELAQVRDRAVERPLGGERADVQLVEHELRERDAAARRRSQARGVDDARGPAQPLRLPARARIGQRARRRARTSSRPRRAPGRPPHRRPSPTGLQRDARVADEPATTDRASAAPRRGTRRAVVERARAERALPRVGTRAHSGTSQTPPSGGSVSSRRDRLAVPRDRLGLDAAEVADVAAAVERESVLSASRQRPARGSPRR